MSKLKKWITSPVTTLGVFALAAGLLMFSSVGGARAALTYYSETYTSRVQMYDIGVTLLENGNQVAWRNYNSKIDDGSWNTNEEPGKLLKNLVPEGEKFKIGKWYPEVLTVQNTGTINQYVRVSVYRYWIDKDGNKMQERKPGLIDLEFKTDEGWMIDPACNTEERTVLYYNKVLEAAEDGSKQGEISPAFTNRLRIDDKVTLKVTEKTEGQKIITTYDYDGVTFCIEATVDAVQEHNIEAAAWSAWGRKVSVNNGILTLVE